MTRRQLVLVRGAARDPAPLASGTRQEEVDVSEEGSPRPAADRARGPGPHRPPRPGEPTVGVPADPRGAAEARDQDLRDDGPDDPAPPAASTLLPAGPAQRGPSSSGHRRRGSSRPTSSPSRRSASRRSTSCSSSSSRPGECTWRASPPTPTRRGSPSRRGTSPSTSGCRVFGSSCATGTPSSQDRSTRCSAPKASGSSERRSAHLGRTPSRSGSCGPCAESASTTS